MTATHTNADAIGQFVTTIGGRNFPLEVLDAARMALVDSIGVAIGAQGEGAEAACRLAPRNEVGARGGEAERVPPRQEAPARRRAL